MSDHPAGKYVTATVRGVEGVPAVRMTDEGGPWWWTPEYVKDHRYHRVADVTDVRPLIMLDLGRHDPAGVVDALLKASYLDLAGQIREQTRPAIDEPTGHGAVVEATCKCNEWVAVFCRDGRGGRLDAWKAPCGHHHWGELIPIRVLFKGEPS